MAGISDVVSKANSLLKGSKGFLSVSGGKYADAILGGVLWLLLVTFLSQSEYGTTVYWHSTALILTAISSLGFTVSFQSLLPKGKDNIKGEGNFLSLLPTLGFAIGLAFFTPINLFAVLLYLFFLNRHQLTIAEILGEQKYLEYLVVSIGKRAVQIVASLGLYYIMGVNGVLLGLSLGVAVASYRSLKNLLTLPSGLSFPRIKAHRSFIVYTFGQTALIGALGQLDRIVIGIFYGTEVLGVYAFVSQIFTFLRMIPGGFSGYLLPEKASGRQARLAELAGIGASAGSSVLTFTFTPWGINWLFPNFSEAISAVRLISITPIILMFSVILTTHFLSREEGRTPFVATIFSNVVRVLGVLVLYSFFKWWGMGAGLVMATLAALIFLWLRKRFTDAKEAEDQNIDPPK